MSDVEMKNRFVLMDIHHMRDLGKNKARSSMEGGFLTHPFLPWTCVLTRGSRTDPTTLTILKRGVAGVEHRAWVPRINSFIRALSESWPISRTRTNKFVRATLLTR